MRKKRKNTMFKGDDRGRPFFYKRRKFYIEHFRWQRFDFYIELIYKEKELEHLF